MIVALFEHLFNFLWILFKLIPYLASVVVLIVGLVSVFLAIGSLYLHFDKIQYEINYLMVSGLLIITSAYCFGSVIHGIATSTYLWLIPGPVIFSLIMVKYN